MPDFLIRPERNGDAAAIYVVTREAFAQPAEADLVSALRASGDEVCSLVAEVDGAVVGHVMLSKLVSPARCLGLAPLSVLPNQQKMGIGAALMKRAIEVTGQQGWLSFCWVVPTITAVSDSGWKPPRSSTRPIPKNT